METFAFLNLLSFLTFNFDKCDFIITADIYIIILDALPHNHIMPCVYIHMVHPKE